MPQILQNFKNFTISTYLVLGIGQEGGSRMGGGRVGGRPKGEGPMGGSFLKGWTRGRKSFPMVKLYDPIRIQAYKNTEIFNNIPFP